MTYIIAEIGGNHDGKIEQAYKLIEQAALAGANAVKFQTYQSSNLVHPDEKALPQAKGYDKQIDRFKDLEFTREQWQSIIKCCKEIGIDFMTTCFDLESLEEYAPHMKWIKISSGDLTYHRLHRAAALTGKPVIISTGMAEYREIEEAARLHHRNRLTVMHCVSSYPCLSEDANLGVIPELSKHYVSVGYSDHTNGLMACQLAVALGCVVIEKHFTLDSHLDYGDHPISAEPHELKELCESIVTIESMMGEEKPCKSEAQNRIAMRRGAYAAKDIRFGQIISENDVLAIRPANKRKPHTMIGVRA